MDIQDRLLTKTDSLLTLRQTGWTLNKRLTERQDRLSTKIDRMHIGQEKDRKTGQIRELLTERMDIGKEIDRKTGQINNKDRQRLIGKQTDKQTQKGI